MTGNHSPSNEPANDDLASVLDTGPFPDALRAAIRSRGLSLERLQQRLRMVGADVSAATLSYWQTGRTRPERPRSLVALGHLERILRLPPCALSALLGPPRPRGRWLHQGSEELGTRSLWPQGDPVNTVLRGVNTQWDSWLTRISQHDRFTIGPDRCERSSWTRQVLRAEDNGPDRWVVLYQTCAPGPIPAIRAVRPCTVGRQFTLDGSGLVAAEILFGRALAKGETVVCEYQITHRPPHSVATNYERKFRFSVREYVLEVRFTPPALPTKCYQYEAMTVHEPEQTRELAMDAAGGVHAVALGFGPGRYGIRWEWD